jgi:hypothetical protein
LKIPIYFASRKIIDTKVCGYTTVNKNFLLQTHIVDTNTPTICMSPEQLPSRLARKIATFSLFLPFGCFSFYFLFRFRCFPFYFLLPGNIFVSSFFFFSFSLSLFFFFSFLSYIYVSLFFLSFCLHLPSLSF